MPATGIGWEFVYPKDQATQLSINTKTPVLTGPAPGTLAQQTSINGLTRTGAGGQSTAYTPSTTPTPVSGGVLRGSMDPDEGNQTPARSADNAAAAPAPTPAQAQAPSPRAIDSNSAASSPAPAPDRSTTMAQNNAPAQNSVSVNDRETRSTRTTLPATAGNSPLAALAGVLALAAALGLGVWRRVA
jgi:hypothetical protein